MILASVVSLLILTPLRKNWWATGACLTFSVMFTGFRKTPQLCQKGAIFIMITSDEITITGIVQLSSLQKNFKSKSASTTLHNSIETIKSSLSF
jgi:hypothetical protein